MADTGSPIESGYKYILAYGLFIVGIIFLMKTKLGYNIIYYSLILGIMLLLLIEAKPIARILMPLSGYNPDTDTFGVASHKF